MQDISGRLKEAEVACYGAIVDNAGKDLGWIQSMPTNGSMGKNSLKEIDRPS